MPSETFFLSILIKSTLSEGKAGLQASSAVAAKFEQRLLTITTRHAAKAQHLSTQQNKDTW